MDPVEASERAAWREANRGFLARDYPIAAVREQLERPRTLDRGRWRASCAMGWIGLLAEPEEGGLGFAPELLVDLAEELGRALNPAPFLGNALSAAVIARDPTVDRVVLERILDGSVSCAWCVLEGDRPPSLETILLETRIEDPIQHDPTQRITLTGSKSYVLDADLADLLLVSVRVDGELRNFVVSAEDPGVKIVTAHGLDLTRRISRVDFDGATLYAGAAAEVAVTEGSAPAPPNPGATAPTSGEAAVRAGLRLGAVLCCADAVGVAERLMEMTVEYVSEREVFGRTLAHYQAVKHKCADMLCAVESAQLATLNAARALARDGKTHPGETNPDSNGEDPVLKLEAEGEIDRAVSVAKGFVGEACTTLAGEALQLHGGIGFTWEHNLHLYLRRARMDEALFGTTAWHRERLGDELREVR